MVGVEEGERRVAFLGNSQVLRNKSIADSNRCVVQR